MTGVKIETRSGKLSLTMSTVDSKDYKPQSRSSIAEELREKGSAFISMEDLAKMERPQTDG